MIIVVFLIAAALLYLVGSISMTWDGKIASVRCYAHHLAVEVRADSGRTVRLAICDSHEAFRRLLWCELCSGMRVRFTVPLFFYLTGLKTKKCSELRLIDK